MAAVILLALPEFQYIEPQTGQYIYIFTRPFLAQLVTLHACMSITFQGWISLSNFTVMERICLELRAGP